MDTITMCKYQGLGNDYLVLDPNKNQISLQARDIERLCRRNFGVGADGILYGPVFAEGKIRLAVYNSDGSETERSGNGIRIFAKYLRDAGYCEEKKIVITTKSGDLEVEFLEDEGNVMRVNMGKADFMSTAIPVKGIPHEIVNEPLRFRGKLYNTTCLSVGNPNCVIMTEDVSGNQAKSLGPYVENASYFPKRMNMQLCKVESRNQIRIEIYERGAGYTLASGTGACAAAATAWRLGLVDRKITVKMPGGDLLIEIEEDGTMFMTGTVEKVGTFTLAENFFA